LGEELTQQLARYGYKVTVAAGYPHHPYGRIFPGYQKRWLSVEEDNGYRLVRGWHIIHPSPSNLMRVLIMVTQCCSYFISALYAHHPEMVISFDGYPLLGPLVSSLIAKLYGAKSITVIYDIYPDIAVELGKLRNPQLIALARIIENLVYRWSDKIVVLSEGFRRTLVEGKGVSPEKIIVIPVWLDAKDITPLDQENPWRREMGIPPEKFVILYAGTIGLVSGAEIIVEVAQSLASYPEIQFLMVGDGYAKEQVQAQASNLGLQNIRFLPFQPRERLSELQATADISLVTLSPGRGRTSVPSKVLGYMAAARPIIASVDEACDTASLVEEANCGLVVPPGNGEALAQAILYYYNNPSERISSGKNGLGYFLEKFDKKRVTKQYIDLIENLISR
jgi:colanic acid biosynthesis glycosyl transferase WcaI